jgi:hypothetical protein
MTRSKSTILGPVWTRVLQFIGDVGAASTEDVARAILPSPSDAVTSAQLGHASRQLTPMERAKYVRRIDGDSSTYWTLGVEGYQVLALMAAPKLHRRYRTERWRRIKAKHRRDELMAAGWCINGKLHGKATRGCRCDSCHATHRRSV